MKPTLATAMALFALGGCASSSVRERPSDFRDGLGPDLRIFSDNLCLSDAPVVRGGALDLAADVVKGVAGLAVKSFGRFLEEVGSPEIETATGIHAALYFDDVSDPPVLNPDLRCLYIVRDGFELNGFSSGTPTALRTTWERLGLTGTPSLYVMARLDPAIDGTDYFKASILDFTVQRFARAGAESRRDYVVFFEFVLPSGGRQYRVNDQGEITFEPSGPFARGGVPLRGVQKDVYLDSAELKGVETGWMTGPPRVEGAGQRPVNLYVDVVELKRGNPFMADLGRFLQSPPIANAAGEVAEELVRQTEREDQVIAADIAAEKTELALVQKLELEMLSLRGALADAETDSRPLLMASQEVEEAVSAIEFHKRQKGWRSVSPDTMTAAAKTLAGAARARVNSQ